MSLLITLGIACVALVFLYLLYRRNFNYWSRVQSVPSMPGRMFNGNFWDIITLQTHFGLHLKNLYDKPKFAHEPVVGFYGLYRPCLLVREPQLLKSIFIKDSDCFPHRFMQLDARKDKISRRMLVYARNPVWQEMRNKLEPFFSGGSLKRMYPLLQSEGDNLDSHLKQRSSATTPGFVAEIKEICCLYVINVMSTTIFGVPVNCFENPRVPIHMETLRLMRGSWWRTFNHFFIHFMPELSGLVRAKFFANESLQFVRSAISQAMADRERRKQVRHDLIEIFLQLQEESQCSDTEMPQLMEGLYAQAAQFWVTGFETTASVIYYALVELAKHPELQEILRAEIRECFVENKGKQMSFEALNNLPYLHMVVHETMRLYPLMAFIERQYANDEKSKVPYTLKPYNDYAVPEGMPVYASIYGIHYDEKYWPNPEKFDPERFSPSQRDKIQPMTYFPFGMGPRACIGGNLALVEVKVGVVHFLKNHCVRSVCVQIKDDIYLEIIRDDMCDAAVIHN